MKKAIAIILVVFLFLAMGFALVSFIMVRNAANIDVEATALEATNASYVRLMDDLQADTNEYEHTILIDPVAGGLDRGLTQGDINEAEITLAVASLVKAYNSNEQVRIVLTRDTDTNPTIEQRQNIYNTCEPDVVIELRVSSDASASVMGVTAHYYDGFYNYKLTNADFADALVRNVAGKVQTKAIGVFSDRENNGLASNELTSVSLSLGYISNSDEGKALMADSYRQNMARGILDAIAECIQ